MAVGPAAAAEKGSSTAAGLAQPNGGGPLSPGATGSGPLADSHTGGELKGSTDADPGPAGKVTVCMSRWVSVVHLTVSPGTTCSDRGSISRTSVWADAVPAVAVTVWVPSGLVVVVGAGAADSAFSASVVSACPCALPAASTSAGRDAAWASGTTVTAPCMPGCTMQMKLTVVALLTVPGRAIFTT